MPFRLPAQHDRRETQRSRSGLIIAAGVGSRLGAIGARTHKGLLRIGAETLLGRSTSLLRMGGVDEIFVVTGYRESDVKSALGFGFSYVHNPRYAQTGVLHSVLLCAEQLSGQCLVVTTADNFVASDAIRKCLESTADVVPLVRRGIRNADRAIGVRVERGAIVGAGSARSDGWNGEFSGFVALSPSGSREFFKAAADLLPQGGLIADAVTAVSGLPGLRSEVVWCTDSQWADVDTIGDLRRVRALAMAADS